MDELSAILDADQRPAEKQLEQRLSSEQREMLRQAKLGTDVDWFQTLPAFQALPEDIREAHISGDPIGSIVKRWATAHSLDDEERVPFLNFENLVVHSGRRKVVIRNGVSSDGVVIDYSASFGNWAGAFNL